MKKQVIKKYLFHVLVYTAIYMAVALLLDFVFNGVVIEYLVERLPMVLVEILWYDKTATSMIGYIIGLLAISVVHIFRLTRILGLASDAILREDPALMEGRYAQELKDFSGKLRQFKTQIRENEEARKLAEQQKNDLIVYLAHDLKTPLTSVIGYLSLLEESPELPPEQRAKYTGIALDKAYRLETLINEFFDITRLNLQTVSMDRAEVNLTVLLLQVISEFYPMLESRGMTMCQEITPELKITGDGAQLARVFENLLRNAVNYGAENTPVICIAVPLEQTVQVKLRNEGRTIPPEKLSRMFDKFCRLDDARQSSTGGTGLGLAIAKQIVEHHGGTITAASMDGMIEFTVELPKHL